MKKKCDFGGYATRNDLECSDGRIIRRDAFKGNHGRKVPMVWQHNYSSPASVLGSAVLENRKDGVYAYCTFNNTELATHAKELVRHGDINALSIGANSLKQDGNEVLHGVIREVSLVMAGANPGARIEDVCITHEDGMIEDRVIIHSDELINPLIHSYDWEDGDEDNEKDDEFEETDEENDKSDDQDNTITHADDGKSDSSSSDDDETIQDVIDSMNEKQLNVMFYLIDQADQGKLKKNDDENQNGKDDETMKHNLFDTSSTSSDEVEYLTHADMEEIVTLGRRAGSLKQGVIDFCEKHDIEHGIENIDILFPEAKAISDTPDMISRQMSWVSDVLGATKKSPFSRVKSIAADVTEDEARAKGYIKGKQKVEEVFNLLKRTTEPKTIYKLQKLDRDDVIDASTIDTAAFMKAEMRMMLNEEIARAILVGDGRSSVDNDKIDETKIRPIYSDNDLYTIHESIDIDSITDETDKSNALIDKALRARKNYKGSGNPTLYASTDVINDMLLAKDKIGRRLYNTVDELASALRVSRVVEVPVLEGVKRTEGEGSSAKDFELVFLIVNLTDYNVGTDKGGEVNMFDDFDLDFNKYEYLIETRCSGALVKPFSAIAIEKPVSTTPSNPSNPSNPSTPSTPEAEG